MNTAATFRTTSEINVKARVKALVFGDDNRIINPGDLLLEMVDTKQGNRLGANQTRFEVYISGRDIEQLLGQVERAAYLWRENDWLRAATTRILSKKEKAERVGIPIVPKPKPIFNHAKDAELTARDAGQVAPRLLG